MLPKTNLAEKGLAFCRGGTCCWTFASPLLQLPAHGDYLSKTSDSPLHAEAQEHIFLRAQSPLFLVPI